MKSAAYATLTSIVCARRVRTSAFVERQRQKTPRSQVAAEQQNNWFSDGRKAAIDLKRELGILDDDDDLMSSKDDINRIKEEEVPANEIEDAIETGKAAARALLAQMSGGGDGGDDRGDSEDAPDDRRIQKVSFQKNDRTSDSSQHPFEEDALDVFNLPARKSHSLTVCMVPPASATLAWAQLTAARRRCKDPGFFRWPPHVNIVYPFLEPILEKDSIISEEDQRKSFQREVARHLALAAEQVEPFDVTIDSFGIFGGKSRGVMWAYPRSKCTVGTTDEEPLITMQKELEKQFPMCTDQRKNGKFSPHMTISHYEDSDGALEAKTEIEESWASVSFNVPEIYLLRREGDGGQFKILATIPLGCDPKVEFNEAALPFVDMPLTEEDWVREERMAMKKRRNGNRRRRNRRGSNRGQETEKDAQ